MRCEKCDGDVPGECVFCPHCGTRLDGGADDAGSGAEEPSAGAERLRAGRQSSGGKQPAEQDLWSGTYSPKAMYGSFAAALVVTLVGLIFAALSGGPGFLIWGIGVVVVWGGLLLLLAYRRLTVRYRLTTYRFFHETGLLSRVGNRIEVIDVDDVTVHQGLVERLFGVGTILIQSSDRTDPELRLPGIDDAKQVADLIDSTRRAERNRRGLFMENV